MIFQITKIEFDFAGDNLFTENDRLDLIEETIGSIWEVDDEYGPYPEEEKQGVINQTMTTIWEADDEEDLIEEITCASGWCIKSIDYRHVLS